METETIKKIVELANEFEWLMASDLFESYVEYKGNFIKAYNIYRWEYYPILLYRAVEGWKDNLDDLIETNNFIKTYYLSPQEQAIEACLIELLEDKK